MVSFRVKVSFVLRVKDDPLLAQILFSGISCLNGGLKVENLSNEDGNVNENVEKQWSKLQNTITARGNATTWPLFRRRL